MFCSHCGARLRSGARFCEECGRPRAGSATQAEAIDGRATVAEPRGAVVPSADGRLVISAEPPIPVVQMPSWVVGVQGGGQAVPAAPAQAIQFNPHINVAVAPPPAAPQAPLSPVVVVESHDHPAAVAAAVVWMAGVAGSLFITLLLVGAFVSAHIAVALLWVLPAMWTLFLFALLSASRRFR